MIAMQKLLPERQSPMNSSGKDDLNVELIVPSNHPAIGMTIEEVSEKYNLKENHIVVSAIQRFDHELVYPVAADEFIMGGDHLHAIGTPKNILTCVNG